MDFAPELERRGYDIRILRPSPLLPSPVSDHADMLCFPLGDGLLVCRYYYEKNRDSLAGVPTVLTDEKHGNAYPYDVLLNAFIFHGKLYGKIDSLCGEIVGYCAKNAIKSVKLRQGYAKCSTLLTPRFAAAADSGIVSALAADGIDTLKLSAGGVSLSGYESGFIGGASFYDDETVFFFGDVSTHPDADKLLEKCEQHGMKAVSLSRGALRDVGGAVLL